MICVSGAISYQARSHIYGREGDVVRSGPDMKVLGYHLSSHPGVHAHIRALGKRMRKQYWVLYHLRRAGFSDEDLAKVYRTCILPTADYCAVVYHSQLTDEQDQAVERLQAGALRSIYGPEFSYARMREMAGVTTLRERRVQACDKFASKCATSAGFSAWFPPRESGRSRGRKAEVYHEDYARCD